MFTSKISLLRKAVVCLFVTGLCTGFILQAATVYAVASHSLGDPPIIREVFVGFGDSNGCANISDADHLVINGVNLDNGFPPIVTLGAEGRLTVCSFSDTEVIALPPSRSCPTR